ncbi:MAG: hypothetical protein L0099_15360 [Acidobacteria bacterium]|nr:hypothetical protein [Acidobacteriota bacterium]
MIRELIMEFPSPFKRHQGTKIGLGRDGLVHQNLDGSFVLICVTQCFEQLSDICPSLEVARLPGFPRSSAVIEPHHSRQLLCRRDKLGKVASNRHWRIPLSLEIVLGGRKVVENCFYV